MYKDLSKSPWQDSDALPGNSRVDISYSFMRDGTRLDKGSNTLVATFDRLDANWGTDWRNVFAGDKPSEALSLGWDILQEEEVRPLARRSARDAVVTDSETSLDDHAQAGSRGEAVDYLLSLDAPEHVKLLTPAIPQTTCDAQRIL